MPIGKFQKVSLEQFIKDVDVVNVEEIYNEIPLPKRATKESAGYDFVCPIDIEIKPNEMIKIPTGIRCHMEQGYVLNIYPRSSLGMKYQMYLTNTTGIIDSDYYNAKNEGHIIVSIVNKGDKILKINKGERFVQGIFLKYYTVIEEEVLDQRNGGFGSTGN